MTKRHLKKRRSDLRAWDASSLPKSLRHRLQGIKLLAMDVDGVLTDGAVLYDSGGGEQKRFHVADGLGIVLLRHIDVEVAWISGRASALVERRANELGVKYVMQGVRDKRAALQACCALIVAETPLSMRETAYIGDDWNDLPALSIAGVRIAVANAIDEVKAAADITLQKSGGQGAVRETVEMLLAARGQSAACLDAYLRTLTDKNNVKNEGHGLNGLIGQ